MDQSIDQSMINWLINWWLFDQSIE